MPRHSEELLQSIIGNLESDPRVAAVWLAGSRGRATSDEFSDIDIWVAIEAHAIPDVVREPLVFIHEMAPTIMHVIAAEIAPPGGAFVGSWVPVGQEFEQVDWYLTPASNATRAVDTTIAFGDVSVAQSRPTAMLSDHEIVEKVNDSLDLALQMISNTFKYHLRRLPWRVVNSARHANDCLAKAEFILRNGHEPDYHAQRRSFLPDNLPHTDDDVRAMLNRFIDEVDRIAAERDISERIAPASRAIRVSILSD